MSTAPRYADPPGSDQRPSDGRILQAVLRQNFEAFVERTFHALSPGEPYFDNWHIRLICDRLEQVRRGEITRLIINLPPRSLKSMLVSVAFPAFVLGHDPRARFIVASYGAQLADKFGNDTRSLIHSVWYRRLFPHSHLLGAKPPANDFMTTARGGRLAVSAGGPITGRGASYFIIDDPLKASAAGSDHERDAINAWYDQNVVQRLDDKRTGAIIVVMQRLHDEDLSGYLMEKGGWEILRLPAIAVEDELHQLSNGEVLTRPIGEALHPERESLEVLNEIKRTIGAYEFAGQYQQDPAPREGALVHANQFPRRSSEGVKFEIITQSWDTAHKTGSLNDYSVCTTWGRTEDKKYYLLDLFRAKLAFPQLVARVRTLYEQYKPYHVLIEDGASGQGLIQSLRQEGKLPIRAIKPEGDKVTRLNILTGLIESGYVVLPIEAPWIDDFLLEITRFPRAKHDDQVDSFTQGLSHLRKAFKHQFW